MLYMGLECQNRKCVHDSTRSYRLRVSARLTDACPRCCRGGDKQPPRQSRNPLTPRELETESDWYRCKSCVIWDGKEMVPVEWQRKLYTEYKDFVFPKTVDALVQAQSQASLLGVDDPQPGNTYTVMQQGTTRQFPLQPFCDARLVWFQEEPMRRIAVYFRTGEPEPGEEIGVREPFQKVFPLNATAAERRGAPEMQVPKEMFDQLTQVCDPLGMTKGYSSIRCQHCHQPLPTSSLATTFLRTCELGD